MAKVFIAQVVTGTIFYLLFGWFVFDFILGEFTDQHTTHLPGFKKNAGEFSYVFLLVSCMAYSTLITFVLSLLSKTRSLKERFYISSIIGVLVATMTDTYWYASSNFYLNYTVVLLDIVAAAITVGSLGVVVTLVSGFQKKPN